MYTFLYQDHCEILIFVSPTNIIKSLPVAVHILN